jgi:hypothetical protein
MLQTSKNNPDLNQIHHPVFDNTFNRFQTKKLYSSPTTTPKNDFGTVAKK